MRKIAIVAKGGTSSLAPWNSDWEIWGIPWIKYPNVDLLFEVHHQDIYDKSKQESYYHDQKWIENIKCPIYCVDSRLHLPNAIRYPIEDILNSLPIPYLENSIAYMLALAIYQNVDEIGLWGVHMRGIHEYEAERPSVTYLIGLAQGKGIKITIPGGCPLFASTWEMGRYGINMNIRNIHPGFN